MKHERQTLPSPKQARAIATRAKIIKAAIGCLSELGMAGTSTTAIARRASVSQGALFKHFPSKSLLLAVATEHVFEEMRAHFIKEVLLRVQEDPDRAMSIGLTVLWEIYQQPRLKSVFELYLATRTDEDLKEVLEPVVTEHFHAIMSIASALFPKNAGSEAFQNAVMSLMLTLQGAAMMTTLVPGHLEQQLSLDFLSQFAVSLLGAPDIETLTGLAQNTAPEPNKATTSPDVTSQPDR